MDINGVAEFLQFLKDGGELSEFELLGVQEYDKAEMRYSVTLGYRSLAYSVSSWMPAVMVRRDILKLAREVAGR